MGNVSTSLGGGAADAGRGPVVAVDASRNRSGGAKAHLLGILGAVDPREHGVAAVHVWSTPELLNALPDRPWLTRHSPPALAGSLPQQMWWQARHLSAELTQAGCDILLSTDAGTVCRHHPNVVMSRDMLSFEPGEMQRYSRLSFSFTRLLLLKYMQVSSLRHADGAVFLTQYAARVIQGYSGALPNVRVIPHGVSEDFRHAPHPAADTAAGRELRCLYVSNADLYKHQWQVVRAMARLRQKGLPVRLVLLGGGAGRGQALLDEALAQEDPQRRFVEVLGAVPHRDIPQHLAQADLFIFASSCENMPNTLVEAMAAGLPIASSQRGPMPEILQDAGTYFDPEDPDSIADAVARLVADASLRGELARKAHERAAEYSWQRCARETWSYLVDVWRRDAVTSGSSSRPGSSPARGA